MLSRYGCGAALRGQRGSVMERFHLAQFLDLANMLREPQRLGAGRTKIGDDFKQTGLKLFAGIEADCKALSFRGPAAAVKRVINLLNRPDSTFEEFHNLMADFLSRITDEMEETYFMALSPREAEEYSAPWKQWNESVFNQFPAASWDVVEAGRCLALGRYTASVFHLMRVVESGIKALRAALGVAEPAGNPSWHTLLETCDREIKKRYENRSDEFKGDLAFYSEAVGFLRSIMYAWRNPTMHIEESYTEEEARAITVAVQGFMRHLATKLSE